LTLLAGWQEGQQTIHITERNKTRSQAVTGMYVTYVTKVTFHLPPTATHLLGEWTLPSRALLLISSDAPDEVI